MAPHALAEFHALAQVPMTMTSACALCRGRYQGHVPAHVLDFKLLLSGPSSALPQSAFFASAVTAGARMVAAAEPLWAPFWGLRTPLGFSRLRGVLRALHSAPAARAPASGASQ